LYRKFGHAYDAFKTALVDPSVLEGLEVETNIKDTVVRLVKRKLTPQPLKIRADFELCCFQYEGVDALKAALRKGEAVSTEQLPVKIKLVAPPLYVVVTTTINKDAGITLLNKALEAIKEEITARKGEITIKVAPRPIQEKEEKEFHSILEKLEKENQEKPGDSDSSEGDEEDAAED